MHWHVEKPRYMVKKLIFKVNTYAIVYLPTLYISVVIRVNKMKIFRKTKFYVYQLPTQWQVPIGEGISNYNIVDINLETIDYFFPKDPRRKEFKYLLAKGFFDIIQHLGRQWISYAWLKVPGTVGPPHLPLFTQKLDVYWIFYCRTVDEFQRQGCYKRSLVALYELALNRNKDKDIFIDTEIYNIALRKAIISMGFEPSGPLVTKGTYLAKLKYLVLVQSKK